MILLTARFDACLPVVEEVRVHVLSLQRQSFPILSYQALQLPCEANASWAGDQTGQCTSTVPDCPTRIMRVLYLRLRIPSASFSRKARESKFLSIDESERVLGVQYLIDQVERMILETRNPEDFNAATWLAQWLSYPLPDFTVQR